MNTAKVERTRVWRSAFASPVLYFLGSCCWLAGAALNASVQPRTGAFLDSSNQFLAAGILYIIASALWIVGALISIVAAYAEVALLMVKGRTPGLGRLLMLAAWHELIGSILLLVASAIWLGGGVTNTSTGGILWMIGSWIFLVGMLILTVISLIVGSVTSIMGEMLHRQRAWFSIASTIMFTTGLIFFVVGACAYTVVQAPGFMLFASLLWLIASGLWVISFLVRMCGAWYYFVPILSFATAAAATSGLVAGSAAQPGLVGGTSASAASVENSTVPAAGVPKAGSTTGMNGGATHAMAAPAGEPTVAPAMAAPTAGEHVHVAV